MEEESKNMFFDAIFEKQHHVNFYHHQNLNEMWILKRLNVSLHRQ